MCWILVKNSIASGLKLSKKKNSRKKREEFRKGRKLKSL